jgi:hypothetical protein
VTDHPRQEDTVTTYTCTDGNAAIDIRATSAREAAEAYVNGGDWSDATRTQWVIVHVTDPDGEREYPAMDGGE